MSTKSDLTREIASARRDIFIPVFGATMRPTDDVLLQQGNGKGLKIYEEIERDPLAYAVIQKRKLAVVAREWEVEAAGPRRDDRKAAELVERVLAGEWGLSFDKVCVDLLDATLKGYAVAEVIWGEADGFLVPLEIKPKDQRRFVFDPDGRVRLLTFEAMAEGEEVPDRKFLVHRFGDKSGDPYGRGLGHQLFWWIWFKRQVMQFWLVFAEKFGSPTVVGEYPDTMLPEDQDKLLDQVTGIAQQTGMIVPAGTVVKMLEAMRSGNVTYPDLIEYCDRQITLAVLGNTLTTSEGNAGSRALGQVHAGVEDTIVDADADMLSGCLNSQLVEWITWLNYPAARPPKVWRPRPTEEQAEAKLKQEQVKAGADALAFVRAMRAAGYEPEDEQAPIIDQALGKWTYTGTPTGVPLTPSLPAPVDAAPQPDQVQLRAPDGTPDAADDLAEQLAIAAMPAMDDLVNQVRAVIASTDDLGAVAQALLEAYPSIDDGQLARVLAQAMTAGAATGANEADNG
ncbi:MAG: DUF935 family protein [Pseudomonadota bacterium]